MHLKLLLVFALIDVALCIQLTKSEHRQFFHSIPFIAAGLLTAIILRHLLQGIHVVSLNGVILVIMGLIYGFIARYSEYMNTHYINLDYVELTPFFFIYMPLACFSLAFSINVNSFTRSILQIIIISVPVAAANICFNGFIMKIVIGDDWSVTETFYFGFMMNPIYPLEMLAALRQTGAHVKHVCTLLEGEALIGMTSCIYFVDIFLYLAKGEMTEKEIVVQESIAISVEIALGIVMGLLGRYMMRRNMSDIKNLVAITLGLSMFGCYLASIVDGVGAVTVTLMALFMSAERAALQSESYTFLQVLWKLISYTANVFLFLYCGVIFTSQALPLMEFEDFALTFVTFLMVNVGRFICLFLFVPILSRIEYGMSFSHMLLCVWGGLKSPFMLLLSVYFYSVGRKKEFVMHGFGVFMWSLLINGSTMPILLKVLGLSKISLTRQTNMNNCMRYVIETREKIIDVLKMDRFLSDANWAMVQKLTALKHPYKIEMDIEDEVDHDVGSVRSTVCPDCHKDVVHEPTNKEFREMIREARMRVLKAKKISYAQQYANGLLSKNTIATLTQAVEVAMDTKEAVIELEGLEKLFKSETLFYRFLRRLMGRVYKVDKDADRVPIQVWKQWCHVIAKHIGFQIFMAIVILAQVATILFELFYSPREYFFGMSDEMLYIFFPVDFLFLVLYTSEFLIKIYGFAWVSVWRHGIPTYFRQFWNWFDFIFLLVTLVNTILTFLDYLHYRLYGECFFVEGGNLMISLKIIQMVRVLRLLYLVRPLVSLLVQCIDHTMDAHREYVYDVGKGYLTADEELLQVINHMIDNQKILEDMKRRIENDRLLVIKLLAAVQKERPVIAVTVKTRQTCRAVLSRMKDALNELKISGWVDDTEYAKLNQSIRFNDKSVNNIRSVSPCAPRVLFDNVLWIKRCKPIVRDYIYSKITTKKFDPNDVVYSDGEIAEGIYIVVNGLFLLCYRPQPEMMRLLETEGRLPVAEYMPIKKYKKPFFDYIVNGNNIGTLSTITQRRYTATIVSETYSEVYLIKRNVIKKAMRIDPDPVKGFECQLWRGLAIRIAISVLLQVPAYQSYTHDKLRNLLGKGFVPNLRNYKTFIINDMIEAVVLIEGMVVDGHSDVTYIAPSYIPRNTGKLFLPPTSKVTIPTELTTRLLIIPTANNDEYDIMVREEETCELISRRSSRCLQHLVAASQHSTANIRQKLLRDRRAGLKRETFRSKSKITIFESEVEQKVTEKTDMSSLEIIKEGDDEKKDEINRESSKSDTGIAGSSEDNMSRLSKPSKRQEKLSSISVTVTNEKKKKKKKNKKKK